MRKTHQKSKRLFSLLLCVIFMLTLSSCWDSQDIDRVAIVIGLGIDKGKQAGNVLVSVQIAKISGESGGSGGGGGGGSGGSGGQEGDKSVIWDAEGPTVLSAFGRLRFNASRRLYVHQNQVMIYGESLAKQGLSDLFDSVMRDYELRLDVPVLISKNDAISILETPIKIENISSTGLMHIMDNKSQVSDVFNVTIMDFIARNKRKAGACAIPMVESNKVSDTPNLTVNKMAVFKNSKMVGILDESQTNGYSLLGGTGRAGTLLIKSDEGEANLTVKLSTCKLTPKVDKNNAVTLDAAIELTGYLGEVKGFESMKTEQVLKIVEKKAIETLKELLINSMQALQKMNADALGIGDSIYRHQPKKWMQLKDIWDTIYPNIPLNVKATVTILHTGLIVQSPNMSQK